MSIIDIFYCRLQNGKTWTLRTDLGISFQESKIFCYDDCNYDNYLIHLLITIIIISYIDITFVISDIPILDLYLLTINLSKKDLKDV